MCIFGNDNDHLCRGNFGFGHILVKTDFPIFTLLMNTWNSIQWLNKILLALLRASILSMQCVVAYAKMYQVEIQSEKKREREKKKDEEKREKVCRNWVILIASNETYSKRQKTTKSLQIWSQGICIDVEHI